MIKEILLSESADMGLILSDEAAEKLDKFTAMLLRRNEDMNLTGAATEAEVAKRHILDSLAILRFLPETALSVLDVGSGAGFPGLPMSAAAPRLRITLLDAREKRVEFLREVCGALDIDAQCLAGRAEELAAGSLMREAFDAAVSRAVARLNVLAELCMPFVRVGGLFIAMKSADSDEEIEQAREAIKTFGGSIDAIREYTTDGIKRRAVLIIKNRNTPPEYPRRFSKIQKKPL